MFAEKIDLPNLSAKATIITQFRIRRTSAWLVVSSSARHLDHDRSSPSPVHPKCTHRHQLLPALSVRNERQKRISRTKEEREHTGVATSTIDIDHIQAGRDPVPANAYTKSSLKRRVLRQMIERAFLGDAEEILVAKSRLPDAERFAIAS